jgi:hypothetical protein
MSTWVTILADIRTDLKDTGTTQKFSDGALYLWAKDGIRDYSLHFPIVKYAVTLTLASGSYALPSDQLSILSVECPATRFLDKRLERPSQSTNTYPTQYTVSQGKLYLNASSADDVLLNYEAFHVIPTSAADNTTVMTIPVGDEELLRIYVKAKANEQLRTQQASLDRFKLGQGDRQDNPLEPEVEGLMRSYYSKIGERQGGRTIFLHRQR